MKKQNSVILVLLMLISVISGKITAQPLSKKVDVKWGTLIDGKKTTLDDVLGADQNNVYTLVAERKGLYYAPNKYFVEKYDNDMKFVKSEELILKYGKEDMRFAFSIMSKNSDIYIFSNYQNTKTKVIYLFSQTLDKSTLKPNNDLKKVAEIDYKDFSKYNPGDFALTYSADSSKIMIYFNTPYDKNNNEKFGFVVFDQNLNELWASIKTLPISDKLFKVESYDIDNNGNVYVLGLVFNDVPKEKVKGEPNYNYMLYKYDFNSENVIEYPISVEGKFLTDLNFTINKENDIICAGFYSKDKTYNISGAFYMKIDDISKNVLVSDFLEFDLSMLTQNLSEKKEAKVEKLDEKGKKINLLKYDLGELVIRDNGGITLVGENYYVIVTTSYNAQTKRTTTTYHYYYNQILVVDISAEGKIQWVKQIPKNQHTINDSGFFSSYGLIDRGDNLYFLYNDNPKNLTFKPGDVIYSYKKRDDETLTMLVEVDKDGNVTREAAFNQQKAEVIMRPKAFFKINDDEMILFGQVRKNYRVARLTFK
jgi:hypothetical protein